MPETNPSQNANLKIASICKEWAEHTNFSYEYFNTIDSTNTYAKKKDWQSDEAHLIVAEHQENGRGRGNNLWSNSQMGSSLLSTWCFKLNESPQAITSALVGLAVYRALQSSFESLEFNIKAPNDIYIKDQKLAGILIEAEQIGNDVRIFIGIGLNFFAHPELNDPQKQAGSLSQHLPNKQWQRQDIFHFLDQLLVQLTYAISNCTEKSLNPQDIFDLQMALEKNPLYKKSEIKVFADASLQIKDRIVHWSEL